MKWHEVMACVVTELEAHAGLVGIYGDNMRLGGATDIIVPNLEWHLITDTVTELWAPVVLQFDQWCPDMTTLARSEQMLFRRFHQDLPDAIGGINMWAQYVDGQLLASPDRDGYFARAVRFRFTPLRDLYQPSPTL